MKVWSNEGSSVSDDGRGLKLVPMRVFSCTTAGSSVSDDGRGLKLHAYGFDAVFQWARPSAMTGAD